MTQIIEGPIHYSIAGAKNSFLWQINEAIAACVRPAKEMELHFTAAILQDKLLLFEGLFWRLGRGQIQSGHVFTSLGSALPACWLVTFHFLGNSNVGQCGRSQLGPERITVSVVTVMVSVKHVLYGLFRCFLDIRHASFRTTGEVGVDNNQVVLHLDPDIVAVTLLLDLALAEPNARSNLLYVACSGLDGRARRGAPKGHHAK